ncbi:MAG TPA: DUF1761 domain-containing protein [Terracidiphilus sp.]|nr:DUF1761 domain-containing protein [Terracidiphilus sp.]
MLIFFWLVLCLAGASLILLPLIIWRHQVFEQYSGSRLVKCPQDQRPAAVSIDALHAAGTAVDGVPELRLSSCTCWPERANCNQGCLGQAVRGEAYKEGKPTSATKQIYHLPVLTAAAAAWYLGLIWHSHYLFRTQWMEAIGVTHAQLKQMVGWNAAHVLTVAVCLLFAYGVAWLLAVCHRKGVLPGIVLSVLLCGAVVAASWYGIARLPHGLLAIEAGYVVLAAVTVGAIVGGLYNKLVLTPR